MEQGMTGDKVETTDNPLEAAYVQAEAVTRTYSKSFYLATSLLPKVDRRAVRALYGFCRETDNIVDDPQVEVYHDLNWWREEVNRPWPEQSRPILMAWADTRERYGVPRVYSDELIEGCEMDLKLDRYQTFAELERYCYCVASTVGLMAMHILGTATGIDHEDAKPYAIKLGVAMQLTNFLRDVGEDARRGRIYLPLEDLASFEVRPCDLMDEVITPEFKNLMRFQVARARALYAEADRAVPLLPANTRKAVLLARILYSKILDKVEQNDFDVFSKRARTGKLEKLAVAAKVMLSR